MSSTKPKMLFSKPKDRKGLSPAANHILQIGAIASRLAGENRTMVEHEDGRAENVAEHAHMLARIAPIIAEELYPKLNLGLVSRYATIHDDLEAYVGDTPTHRITAEMLDYKSDIEALALQQLIQEYQSIPGYVTQIKEYEEQIIPETRFVRVLDKIMPLTVHFLEDGKSFARNFTAKEIIDNAKHKAQDLLQEYPEYAKLIDIRNEMVEQAAREFF